MHPPAVAREGSHELQADAAVGTGDEHCRQAALPIQNRRASSDRRRHLAPRPRDELTAAIGAAPRHRLRAGRAEGALETADQGRSEEHTSELQSLMRTSYAVFCLKKKTKQTNTHKTVYNNNSTKHS